MRPSFFPRLINDPFGDPGLFIPFTFQGRALLFDLGDLSNLSGRDLLKVSHVFVTHAHIDHFIGFDRMLRVLLGREKEVHLFGPEGFLERIEAKLNAYTWNLVGEGTYPLVVRATEVLPDRMRSVRYVCRKRFRRFEAPEQHRFEGVLWSEPSLTVAGAVLDHGIPCLGLALAERFHIQIQADRLPPLGAAPGPWLARFKEALYASAPADGNFTVPLKDGGELRLPLGELTERIARITPGQKLAYITDAAYTEQNLEKIAPLAHRADHLFIEAAFLDADEKTAREKAHLTARQAGRIARTGGVRRMTIFHFSPRYRGRTEELYQESRKAFGGGPIR